MASIAISDKYQYNRTSRELFAKRHNEYIPKPGGVGKFFFDRLKELSTDSSIIAQIDADTGTRQNYKQLLESSIKLAQFMRDFGIQPGDHITMCSYNHLNTAVVMIASQFVGAVSSNTDPIISLEDTKYLLNMINPKIVFVSEGSETMIKNALDYHKINAKVISTTLEQHDEYETIEEIMKKTEIEKNFEPVIISDVFVTCAILFSSGTTGLPKGICLPHTYFLSVITLYPSMILRSVMLNYASFYWISKVYGIFMNLSLGSAGLICKKFDEKHHWDIIQRYQVSTFMLSNTHAMEASKNLTKDIADKLTHLGSFMVGGGLIPDKYLSFYRKMLPNTLVGMLYALTECGLVSQYNKGDRFASSGKPAGIDQTIKIVDPDTEKNLPLNQVGEIRIKHPYQMCGYYKMDSKDAWDAEGFLKTGDLGYIDEEYNLVNVDRIKEMFKYRSWHVVPTKIENIFASRPDVLYAAVFGKPTHDADENHAMAVVCLQPTAKTSAEELEAFVNEQLDDINKIRAGVHIVERNEIPFTPTGKINRRLLKNKFVKK